MPETSACALSRVNTCVTSWILAHTQHFERPDKPVLHVTDSDKLAGKFSKTEIWCLTVIFLAPILFVAAILPTFHIDASRLVALGRDFPLLGTSRHPPLSSWLGWLVLQIPFYDAWAAVAVQTLLNALAIRYFWQIGARFLDPPQLKILLIALFTSMLLTIWSFQGFSINEDMAQIPLWAGAVHYLLRATESQKPTGYWIITGVFIGLATLTKYYAIVLVASIVISSIVVAEYRQHWRSAGPWIAIVTAMLLVSPHALWVYENAARMDFFWSRLSPNGPIASSVIADTMNALLGPLILVLPGGLGLLIAISRKSNRTEAGKRVAARSFVVTIFTAMMILSVALPLTGVHVLVRFQAPLGGFFLLVLAGLVPPHQQVKVAGQLFRSSIVVWFVAYAVGVGYNLFGPAHFVSQEPGPALAKAILTDWDQRFECGPAYAIGAQRTANLLAIYGRRPISGVSFDGPGTMPIDLPEKQHDFGAVLLSESDNNTVITMRSANPGATQPRRVDLPMRRNFRGDTKAYVYSLVPPQNCAGSK